MRPAFNHSSMKQNKPSKDLLDFMCYDLGFYEALDHFKLTEEQAELILYGKAETVPQRTRYVQPIDRPETPALSMQVKELKRIVAQHYDQLFKEAGAYISNKIDARGFSRYDVFAEGLRQLLWQNRDFYYIDDDQALAYVRKRLRRALASAARSMRKHRAKVIMVVTYQDPYAMPDFEVSKDLEVLTLPELQIAQLRIEGYTQQEIAYMIDCDQKTVCNRLKRIYEKLQTA